MKDAQRTGRLMYIAEAAFEYFVAILVGGAYLARITGALGFSTSLTGILSSFVSLGCVFQLSSIALFRRAVSVKRPVIVLDMVNQALFALSYLTPVLPVSAPIRTLIFLLCFCSGHILLNVGAPQKTAWLMGLIDDRQRGSFTAKKEIVSLMGGMAFTYAAGRAIDSLEAANRGAQTFLLGAALIAALMLLQMACVSRVPERRTEAGASGGLSLGGVKALLRDKGLRRIVLVFVLWNAASGCAVPFYGAYEVGELGFSMTFISALSIAYSVLRALVSPALGRYADRHSFSRMVYLCFMIAGAGFLVNCFTVPENGRVLYTIYYCLYAVSMGGINSSITNLIFDYVKGDGRRAALALNVAIGGLTGFLSTCAMSPLVSLIQKNGNRLLGLSLYPAQFVSAVAFVLTAILVAYVRLKVIRRGKEEA